VDRVAGVLSCVAGGVVASGTFLPWFHLEGQTSGPRFSFGSFTIYQLSNFNVGFWYSIAGAIILFGAVLLVCAGTALLSAGLRHLLERWSPRVMGAGVLLVLAGALGPGPPHWNAMEPLWWTRGPGETMCVWGAGVGVLALLVVVSSRLFNARAHSISPHTVKEKVSPGA
jgi:hypothetical protein